MSSASGSPNGSSEGMVIVRVADEVNQALTGHPSRRYESPPQSREQALALVEVLIGYRRASPDGGERWGCPIAGGRRTVWLTTTDGRDGPRRSRW